MSYNGIGLKSAKGSATSGHVQKNLGEAKLSQKQETQGRLYYGRKLRDERNQKVEKCIKAASVSIDKDISDHQQKREFEVKIQKYRDQLEDENSDLDDDEIDKRVEAYRIKLLKNIERASRTSYSRKVNPFEKSESEKKS